MGTAMAVPAVATFLGRGLALGTVFSVLIDNERVFTTARAVPSVGFIATVELDPTQSVRPNLACSSLLSDSGSGVLHLRSYRLKQMSLLPFSPWRPGKWERGGREGGNPSIDLAAARVHGTKNTQRGQPNHWAR
jgi:hypothetical protein